MSGRRLIDAAKLAAAARSIASKHVTIRRNELEVFNKTSTVAKAVKDQTDRVTFTAQAAIQLARRLNDDTSTKATRHDITEQQVPRPGTGVNDAGEKTIKEGLEQDHHYGWSEKNASVERGTSEAIEPTQEKPQRYPLPDGTIPPEHSPTRPDDVEHDTFHDRPKPEAAKEPLVAEHRSDPALEPVESGQSTIPNPEVESRKLSSEEAVKAQRRSESQIPEVVADSQPMEDAPGSFHERPKHAEPSLSSLPRSKIPKQVEDAYEGDERSGKKQIDSEVYYEPRGTKPQGDTFAPTSFEDEVPEGVNVNVFRTSRGTSLLGKDGQSPSSRSREELEKEDIQSLAQDLAQDANTNASAAQVSGSVESAPVEHGYQLRQSKVPSTRLGRIWQYGGLATTMAFGAVGEGLRRITGSESTGGSIMMNPANLERLVAKLSRMRGAALKLGQAMSFQDVKMLPPPIYEVLRRVQDSADYMPPSQRDKVLASNLGADWRELFSSFQDVPIAAASIGQVHQAVLRSTGQEVAVKVQYPGVPNSIDSDLSNLSMLLTASRLLPKGLFLEKTIANLRTELAWECDYIREAECASRFRNLLADETDIFTVPEVIHEASGKEVLTATLMHGTAVTKLPDLTQTQRDWIGTHILRLCFREITEFHFMQTDPNWTNFLYNIHATTPSNPEGRIELLDFGASRDYPIDFIDPYVRTLAAASRGERDIVADLSIQLGYLTGHESQRMRDAHVKSIMTLAEPFAQSAPDVYDFRDQTVTDRVRSQIPLMLNERLAPPPEETYSLHRKLSGAFLLCARLGSRIRCREMFEKAIQGFEARVA